jgi:DNA-binding transcriptional LysR family regulator
MLQAFVVSAQYGSFVKASSQLNLTASAISHQIRNLEAWWGVTLFVRHARGVSLTHDGQRLLPVVSTFFDDLESTLAALSDTRPDPIKLACTSSLCQNWLGPRLARDGADFNVALKAIEITPDNIHEEQFDLAIAICETCPPGYDSYILMQDTVFPVCAPDLLKSKGTPAFDLDTLLEFPIIERAFDGICPNWEDWWRFVDCADPPNPQGPIFPDTSMTLRLATSGQGVALGRMALVFEELSNGALVPAVATSMPAPSPYRLLWHSGSPSDHLCALRDWLISEAHAFVALTSERFPVWAMNLDRR